MTLSYKLLNIESLLADQIYSTYRLNLDDWKRNYATTFNLDFKAYVAM
jgi:hypothetical protein